MHIHKRGQSIQTLEDWFTFAPPKRKEHHWKDGRSAKELARFWTLRVQDSNEARVQDSNEALDALLASRFDATELLSAEPEHEVKIDDLRGEHRNCDLRIFANAAVGTLCIHVEAKADETFGEFIGRYYDSKLGTKSKVPDRIRNLTRCVFGKELGAEIRELRYQLLHASYAVVLDAVRSRAAAAVLVVHELRSPNLNRAKLSTNEADWDRFLAAMGLSPNQRKEGLCGPINLPGYEGETAMPLYLGKLTTQVALTS